jgi:hypothetical protein
MEHPQIDDIDQALEAARSMLEDPQAIDPATLIVTVRLLIEIISAISRAQKK